MSSLIIGRRKHIQNPIHKISLLHYLNSSPFADYPFSRVVSRTLLPILAIGVVMISGCASSPGTPQIIEVTRVVEVTRMVEVPITQTPNPEPTFSPLMAFPQECLVRRSDIDFSIYDWLNMDTMGGCRQILPSPDGKYLAYSTRDCSGESICGEAVKIMQAGSSEGITIQIIPDERKMWVSSLGWSSTGELAVSYHNVNSGAGVYVFGEPFVENRSEGERVTGGDIRQWNESRTAFVTFSALGGGYCDGQVGGYDFETGKAFPDVAAILGRDPLELRILPFTSSYESTDWWIGDDEIPLLITPLEYDPEVEDYKFMPTMVGKISITTDGPQYTTLASSSAESYSIIIDHDGFTAKPKPYQPGYCNQ